MKSVQLLQQLLIPKLVPKSRNSILAGSLLAMLACSQTGYADEALNFERVKSLKAMEYTKNLKVTGFKLADGVYMGHAKVGGKYGLGVVVKRKSFSWGINNRGLSIIKRF